MGHFLNILITERQQWVNCCCLFEYFNGMLQTWLERHKRLLKSY